VLLGRALQERLLEIVGAGLLTGQSTEARVVNELNKYQSSLDLPVPLTALQQFQDNFDCPTELEANQ